jgi:hypothetical protein
MNDNETVATEFLRHLESIQKDNKEIKCVQLDILETYDTSVVIILNPNYSVNDYDNFLKAMNVEYNSGYGRQELYGYIWYNDGSWSERYEYDGSEWWEYKKCPPFPACLEKW